MTGKVYIIGVGPGDYKLLTLKAAECIGKADVVVYDRLISSRILSLAREDAELIYAGKMPDRHAIPQEGINEILIKKALEGKTVARVKGGDPFVFGRGGEEAEALIDNGIEFEIIPGVTSSIAVPAYAGIPVTHRDFSSSLHIITGHERPDREESSIDYQNLAKVEGTLVFLMGVKNLEEISTNLIQCGKDSSTPVAVIQNGTTTAQRVVIGVLKDIATKARESKIQSPAVTVIGDVVGLRDKLNWFPKGVLAGKRVIVTRSREQASSLAEKIEELGGEVIEFPTIKIEGLEDYTHFDKVLDNLKHYNWLVFTSVNGVSAFFERMKKMHMDIRDLQDIKLCAVGTSTAAELQKLYLNIEYIPTEFTTKDLLLGMLERVQQGERVLMARADIADKELSEGLLEKGIEVEDLIVYRTLPYSGNRQDIMRLIEEKRVDYITFASSSTVKNFVEAIGKDNIQKLSGIKTVCIGPVTAKTAEALGLSSVVTADKFTIDGLVKKLIQIGVG